MEQNKGQQTLDKFFLKEKIKDLTSMILSKLPMRKESMSPIVFVVLPASKKKKFLESKKELVIHHQYHL